MYGWNRMRKTVWTGPSGETRVPRAFVPALISSWAAAFRRTPTRTSPKLAIPILTPSAATGTPYAAGPAGAPPWPSSRAGPHPAPGTAADDVARGWIMGSRVPITELDGRSPRGGDGRWRPVGQDDAPGGDRPRAVPARALQRPRGV